MPRGISMKTPERVAQARRMYAAGLLQREIAEEIGVATSTIGAWLNDPDGNRLRARKRRYAGTCEDCGRPTDGSSGAPAARRCKRCVSELGSLTKHWTRERIIQAIQEWARRFGGPPSAVDWNPSLARASGRCERAARFVLDGEFPLSGTVQEAFGSWNAAIEAAGFTPNEPGRCGRLGDDPAVVAEIRRLRSADLSYAEIGERVGLHRATVRHHLTKSASRDGVAA